MKIECLLPTLLAAHAPFGDYQAGEQIRDHDAALGYVVSDRHSHLRLTDLQIH